MRKDHSVLIDRNILGIKWPKTTICQTGKRFSEACFQISLLGGPENLLPSKCLSVDLAGFSLYSRRFEQKENKNTIYYLLKDVYRQSHVTTTTQALKYET